MASTYLRHILIFSICNLIATCSYASPATYATNLGIEQMDMQVTKGLRPRTFSQDLCAPLTKHLEISTPLLAKRLGAWMVGVNLACAALLTGLRATTKLLGNGRFFSVALGINFFLALGGYCVYKKAKSEILAREATFASQPPEDFTQGQLPPDMPTDHDPNAQPALTKFYLSDLPTPQASSSVEIVHSSAPTPADRPASAADDSEKQPSINDRITTLINNLRGRALFYHPTDGHQPIQQLFHMIQQKLEQNGYYYFNVTSTWDLATALSPIFPHNKDFFDETFSPEVVILNCTPLITLLKQCYPCEELLNTLTVPLLPKTTCPYQRITITFLDDQTLRIQLKDKINGPLPPREADFLSKLTFNWQHTPLEQQLSPELDEICTTILDLTSLSPEQKDQCRRRIKIEGISFFFKPFAGTAQPRAIDYLRSDEASTEVNRTTLHQALDHFESYVRDTYGLDQAPQRFGTELFIDFNSSTATA